MKNLPDNLILKQMEVGPAGNFIYFIGDSATREIAVVDPAWDVDYLCHEADREKFKITAVILTHGHMDHVNGLDEILSRHDVPAYISKHEAGFYKPKHKNIIEVEDREIIKIGNIEIECLWTPGHTPGGQCLKHKNILITGDTLFIDGCGRCDLPGGNPKTMYNTLYDIILKLPDETVLYTGHNYGPTPCATLGSQKKTNTYLQCHSKNEFLQERMGLFS
ncbi:MAG TPA: MBL fold metallo-hydrolase [Candidatus Omnitrophota bacterium]|nr:MBL fold metallo-hydrolase [Candidatus Omnitrophota bacterium]